MAFCFMVVRICSRIKFHKSENQRSKRASETQIQNRMLMRGGPNRGQLFPIVVRGGLLDESVSLYVGISSIQCRAVLTSTISSDNLPIILLSSWC